MPGRHRNIGPHFYRNLDADSRVVMELPLSELAKRVVSIGAVQPLLRHLVDVRREFLVCRIERRRSEGSTDVAGHMAREGDGLSDGIEALLSDKSALDVSNLVAMGPVDLDEAPAFVLVHAAHLIGSRGWYQGPPVRNRVAGGGALRVGEAVDVAALHVAHSIRVQEDGEVQQRIRDAAEVALRRQLELPLEFRTADLADLDAVSAVEADAALNRWNEDPVRGRTEVTSALLAAAVASMPPARSPVDVLARAARASGVGKIVVGQVAELSLRDLAVRIQALNYGSQRFLSHLVDALRAGAPCTGGLQLAAGIEALLWEGLY